MFVTFLFKKVTTHFMIVPSSDDYSCLGLHQDKQDSSLRSPLHCAAFGGYINCMNLLLEHEANVDLQDKEVSRDFDDVIKHILDVRDSLPYTGQLNRDTWTRQSF